MVRAHGAQSGDFTAQREFVLASRLSGAGHVRVFVIIWQVR